MNDALQIQQSATEFTLTIAANGSASFNVVGHRFQIQSLSCAEILVKTGNTAFKHHRKGTGETMPEGKVFERLEFKNLADSEITVRVWAGFGEYIDNVHTIMLASTIGKGAGIASLAATTAHPLPGSGGPGIQRKEVLVSNFDAANALVVRDADGNYVVACHPQTSIAVQISGDCDVYNPSGTPISCYVGEIWYTSL